MLPPLTLPSDPATVGRPLDVVLLVRDVAEAVARGQGVRIGWTDAQRIALVRWLRQALEVEHQPPAAIVAAEAGSPAVGLLASHGASARSATGTAAPTPPGSASTASFTKRAYAAALQALSAVSSHGAFLAPSALDALSQCTQGNAAVLVASAPELRYVQCRVHQRQRHHPP